MPKELVTAVEQVGFHPIDSKPGWSMVTQREYQLPSVPFMNPIIENLLQLQACETGTSQNSTGDVEIKKLRTKIPAHVLTHYDRLRARGKRGAAFVRRGVCGQCHMQLALGLFASLHRQGDLHCCQTCGAYLWMEEEAPIEMPLRKAKPVRRGRKLPTTPAVPVLAANG
jgi:hypothetical protein